MKFKIHSQLFSFVLLSILCASCSIFMEEDISEETITIYTPSDSLLSNSASQTFWWSEVEGASKYNLQIVSPNFEKADYVDLDTTISTNTFTYSLRYNGDYEWRIKASNGAYETEYSYSTFSINLDMDLTAQVLNVIKPSTDVLLNTDNILFLWDDIISADDFVFILQRNDYAGEYVYPTQFVDSTSIRLPLDSEGLADGKYVWGIRAENRLPSYSEETRGSFTIDKTPPLAPVVTEVDTVRDKEFTLEWTQNAQGETSVYDSIYVYTAENRSILFKKGKVENSSVFNLTDLSTDKTYYWFVKTIDLAGNASEEVGSSFFVVLE